MAIGASRSRLPSSSQPDTLITVGRVGRAHGLDGSFVVEDASDEPTRFRVDAVLWVEGHEARVVAAKRAGGRPVIRIDREAPRGATLSVRASDLPPPADDSYYVFELVGLAVEEEDGRQLGRVAGVSPGVANDVLELDSGRLLPMHEECIRNVDVAAGRIVVARGFAGDD